MVYYAIWVVLEFYGGYKWRTRDALSGIAGLEPKVDIGISGFGVGFRVYLDPRSTLYGR